MLADSDGGSNSLSSKRIGATGGIRTLDLLITNQPLNQAKLRWHVWPCGASRRSRRRQNEPISIRF